MTHRHSIRNHPYTRVDEHGDKYSFIITENSLGDGGVIVEMHHKNESLVFLKIKQYKFDLTYKFLASIGKSNISYWRDHIISLSQVSR